MMRVDPEELVSVQEHTRLDGAFLLAYTALAVVVAIAAVLAGRV